MTVKEAKEKIAEEYPSLLNDNIEIIKQFVSPDGRVSNVFLVKSSKIGFERFIAKSFVHDQKSLEKEWVILKLLHDENANAPRLLIPNQKPVSFILLNYIEGVIATDALAQGFDEVDLFRKMGETAGRVNSIKLNTVGDILNPTNISWKDYFLERLSNGIPTVKSLFDDNLFDALLKEIENLKLVLDEESKKPPRLVHHDIYLDNFILDKRSNELILIDYGIVFGGSPLFDLGKFYIWTLTKYPDQKNNFLDNYSKYVDLPENLNEVLKLYTIKELFGMIDFFKKIGDERMKTESLSTLREYIEGYGIISQLLKSD